MNSDPYLPQCDSNGMSATKYKTGELFQTHL